MLKLFLCIAGALLNIALNMLCTKFGIPLYMDTVLTVSVTFGCGLFWGALTGALTNLIGHTLQFWGWEGYLFALCNIATAFITYLFMRFFPKELTRAISRGRDTGQAAPRSSLTGIFPNSFRLSGVMDRVIILILLSFSLCITMSVLGGLLTYLIQVIRDTSENNPASVVLGSTMFSQTLPPIFVEILSRIPINIIDRLLTAFSGYGIALLGASFPLTNQVSKVKL